MTGTDNKDLSRYVIRKELWRAEALTTYKYTSKGSSGTLMINDQAHSWRLSSSSKLHIHRKNKKNGEGQKICYQNTDWITFWWFEIETEENLPSFQRCTFEYLWLDMYLQPPQFARFTGSTYSSIDVCNINA